ncbi:MAG: protein kinase [Elusimicrobia bacterium]|nr:protein kinase [Elusimicrobiota bacterium]
MMTPLPALAFAALAAFSVPADAKPAAPAAQPGTNKTNTGQTGGDDEAAALNALLQDHNQGIGLPPAGTTGTGGTLPPPTTPPPGGGPPPTPPPGQDPAQKFDDGFGPGAYKGVQDFKDMCIRDPSCDLQSAGKLLVHANKYLDLADEAKVLGRTPEAPEYQPQLAEIRQGLRTTLEGLRPREDSAPEYRTAVAAATKPVVERVFSPEEAKQYTWGEHPGPEPRPKPPKGDPGKDLPWDTNPGLPKQGDAAYGSAVRDAPKLGAGRPPSSFGFMKPEEALLGGSLTPSGASGAEATGASSGSQGALAVVPGRDSGAPGGATTQTDSARSAATLTTQAKRSLSVNDPKAAAALLKQALALNPKDPQALALLSMSESRLKDYPAALKAAEEGLKLAPNNPVLLDAQAYALNGLKDYRGALAAADAALAANPNDALAHFNRAIALAGLGDRDGALAELKTAATLSPKFERYLAMAQGQPDFGAELLMQGEGSVPIRGAAPPSSFGRLPWLAAGGAGVLLLLFLAAGRRGEPPAPVLVPASGSNLLAGKYELGRQLGAGGMGVVYEGKDRVLGRRVAIKRMREEIRWNPREQEKFVAEARVVAKLRHPNIVDIKEIVEEGGEVYLVFEYVAGRTLSELIAAQGRIPFVQARDYLKGIAAAVDHARAQGVIHRDIKPSNVMLDGEGKVRVMDFGIARVVEEAVTRHSRTRATAVVGSPPYMAPEQEQGATRPESDVFSMGVCLYECLTGQRPFTGSGAGMLMNKLKKAFAPASSAAPGLPPGLDAVMAKALDPDPARRYASAGSFLRDLETLEATARAT